MKPIIVAIITAFTLVSPAFAWEPRIPDPVQITCANGLSVLVLERHDLPVVAAYLRLPLGSRVDPPGKEGLQSLTMNMLNRGTATMSRQAVEDRLGELGSTISFFPNSRWDSDGSLQSTSPHFEETLGLFFEELEHPRFDPQELSLAKADVALSQRQQRSNMRSWSDSAMYSTLYEGRPEAHDIWGTAEAISHLSLQDVQQLWHDQLTPNGAVLAIVGDVTVTQVQSLIQRFADNWHGGPARAPITTAPALPGPKIRLYPSEHEAAYVTLAYPAPNMSDRALARLDILSRWFGGDGLTSYLSKKLRHEIGAVYTPSSFFDIWGQFYASWSCDPKNVCRTLEVALNALNDAAKYQPTQQELNVLRDEVRNVAVSRFEKGNPTAWRLSLANYLGNPGYYQDSVRLAMTVTPAQFQQTARQFFQTQRFTAIVFGPVALESQLIGMGYPVEVMKGRSE